MENKSTPNQKFKQPKANIDSSISHHHKRRSNILRTNKIAERRIALDSSHPEPQRKDSHTKPTFIDIKTEEGKKSNIIAATQAGKDEAGKVKENQDSYAFIENVLDLENCNIYGIMDGHGSNGHFVSKFCSEALKKFFQDENNFITKKDKGKITKDILYQKLTHNNYSLLKKFYNNLQEQLIDATFDTHFSGTTMVIVYQIDNKIICSNIGDSRAILVSSKGNDEYQVMNLSNDQKPTNPEEQKRIEDAGGEIACCDDEKENEGVKRVWVKGEKFPGIAISRTLGDEVAKSVGVICTPEFIETTLSKDSCYCIVASDGLWEFYTSEFVKDLSIKDYLNGNYVDLVKNLIVEISGEWESEGPIRDDITLVLHVLNKK